MKKFFFILSACLVVVFTSAAQSDTLEAVDSTSQQDNRLKNEISVNLHTLLVMITNSKVDNPRFGLTYKRRINNSAIRARFQFLPLLRNYQFSYLELAKDSMNIFNRTDVTTFFQFSAGYEKRHFLSKKGYVFVGTDAFYKAGRVEYTSSLHRHPTDSSLTYRVVYENRFDYTRHQFGVIPFIGFNFNFSERLSAFIELSFELFYDRSKYPVFISSTEEEVLWDNNGFEINANPVLNHFSLAYRF